MVSSRDGGHGDTEAQRSNFSAVQEVGTEEADRDEEVEEVDEATGGNLGAVVVRHGGGDGEGDHAERHAGTAEHEDGTAAEAVDGEEGDEGRQELPGQSAARQDARQLSAHAKVLLEEDAGVDGNEVGAGHLLVELEQNAEHEAVEKLVFAHLEHVLERGAALGSLLERKLNTCQLSLNFDSILVVAAEQGNGAAGLVVASHADEPSGRLGEEVDGCHQNKREGDGNGNRRAPSDGTLGELEETKIDPRLENVTDADEETVEDDVLASVLGAGRLALPHRNGGTELTDAKSDDDTADNEVRQGEGGAFQDLTNESADGAGHDDGTAAVLVAGVRA